MEQWRAAFHQVVHRKTNSIAIEILLAVRTSACAALSHPSDFDWKISLGDASASILSVSCSCNYLDVEVWCRVAAARSIIATVGVLQELDGGVALRSSLLTHVLVVVSTEGVVAVGMVWECLRLPKVEPNAIALGVEEPSTVVLIPKGVVTVYDLDHCVGCECLVGNWMPAPRSSRRRQGVVHTIVLSSRRRFWASLFECGSTGWKMRVVEHPKVCQTHWIATVGHSSIDSCEVSAPAGISLQ